MVIYEGIFFDEEVSNIIRVLEVESLEKSVKNLHCTFKYKPKYEEIFDVIVGKEFFVEIVGYGNDGENSGFEIVLPEELHKYYINYEGEDENILTIPHITVSLKEGAKAVNTKNLKFKPLGTPVKIKGTFGYYVREKGKEGVSFKPVGKPINKR